MYESRISGFRKSSGTSELQLLAAMYIIEFKAHKLFIEMTDICLYKIVQHILDLIDDRGILMPPLSIMIKPASGACSLRCRYCFYADEMSLREVALYGMMDEPTLEHVIRKALDAADGMCSITFQGGEPTLAGLPFFEKAVALQERYNHKRLTVHNAIQTNGLLVDGKWAEFFARNHFLVGLSLDGPKELHDRYRLDSEGKGTYNRVFRTAQLLEKHGVEFNILTVVTRQTAHAIGKVYGFFDRSHLDYQQYIPCMGPLENQDGGQPYILGVQDYGNYLCRLFDLWYADAERGKVKYNRTFFNFLSILQGGAPESCNMQGRCSKQYVVEADGSVYPCDFYVLDPWKLGNLNTDNFDQIDQRRTELGFIQQSKAVAEDCRSCRWYGLCRGGCRRDRPVKADGTLDKNMYCQAFQRFFEHAVPRMKLLLHSGALSRKPF